MTDFAQPASLILDTFATFQVYRQGTWYDMSDYDLVSPSRFLLLEEGGIGMPEIEYASERGPEQHGETVIDYHLQPRTIDLVIGALGSNLTDYYNRRKTLLSIFAPSRTPVSLRWTLPNGDVRQIDGYHAGGLELGSSERAHPLYTATAISIRCPSPTFYDPNPQVRTFGLGSGGDNGDIPSPIPTGIGASTIDQINSFTYGGSWRDYPVITIYGPATNLVITNTTTGDVIDFTGYTIAAGDIYVIDLRYGYKTVYQTVNGSGVLDPPVSRLDRITAASSIETFHIAGPDESLGGANSIRVQATTVSTATAVYVQYYERYLGF